MPLLPISEPDPALFNLLRERMAATSPAQLAQIRLQRLGALGAAQWPSHANVDAIRRVVAGARLFFDRWTLRLADVTRRANDEIAAPVRAIGMVS